MGMSDTPSLFDGDLDNIQETFGDIAQDVIADQMQMRELLMQASTEIGVSTIQEALRSKLDRVGMGMRELSLKTGIKRKLLLSMIEGRIDIPPESLVKIIEAIDAKSTTKKKIRYG